MASTTAATEEGSKGFRGLRIEIVAAAILAIAGLLTAWSSYEASQWTRHQAVTGNRVVATLLESSRESTLGGQETLVDVVVFTSWLDARGTDNLELADFYQARFRDEFVPAFDAWVASRPLENPDAPSSPFAMDEYSPARMQAATDLQAEAAELQGDACEASENAAYYVRNTLFLASALFFVGVGRMFNYHVVQTAVHTMALILLLVGIYYTITGPVQ